MQLTCAEADGTSFTGNTGGEGSRRPTKRRRTFPRARRRGRSRALPWRWQPFLRVPWPSRRSALPRLVHLPAWHERRRRVSPPYRQWCDFPLARTAAKGLAALPNGGEPSPGHAGADGAAPSHGGGNLSSGYLGLADARPSRGSCTFLHGTNGGEAYRHWHDFSTGTNGGQSLAALPPMARFPPGTNGGEGPSRPYRHWHDFPRARTVANLPQGTTTSMATYLAGRVRCYAFGEGLRFLGGWCGRRGIIRRERRRRWR